MKIGFKGSEPKLLAMTIGGMLLLCSAFCFYSYGQYRNSELLPPPPVPENRQAASSGDTIETQFPVRPTVPDSYDELENDIYAADLKNPSNITTEAEYDY